MVSVLFLVWRCVNIEKITVITPTFNRASKLLKLYDSLTKQSDCDFIWMIVDDGSVDNTKEIVNSFDSNNLANVLEYIKNIKFL